jgi:hypothetical protein
MAAVANPHPTLIQSIVVGGRIDAKRFATMLHLNKGQLAEATGIAPDNLRRRDRAVSPATQTRLRDVAEVLERVAPWVGGVPQAWGWYRATGLPSFGDRTAEALVKAGHAEAVKSYLNRIAEGGYA